MFRVEKQIHQKKKRIIKTLCLNNYKTIFNQVLISKQYSYFILRNLKVNAKVRDKNKFKLN